VDLLQVPWFSPAESMRKLKKNYYTSTNNVSNNAQLDETKLQVKTSLFVNQLLFDVYPGYRILILSIPDPKLRIKKRREKFFWVLHFL
jgi:hypothetical protein